MDHNETDKFDALPNYMSERVKKDVLYVVHDDAYGYGSAAKGYLTSLQNSQVSFDWVGVKTNNSRSILNDTFSHYELKISPADKQYNSYIFHTIPTLWNRLYDELCKNQPDVNIVGRTVWEFEKMLPEWVDAINTSKVTTVSVPSEWNRVIFTKNGITKPIIVEPHVLPDKKHQIIGFEKIIEKATVLSQKNPHDINMSSFYKFYSIGDFSARKNIIGTIKSFCETFTSEDDVMLLVKIDIAKVNYLATIANLHSIVNVFQNPPLIMIISAHLSDDEIVAIHKTCDCYFQLTRSEGFGLNIFQAMSLNKSIIVPGYGGHVDYLKQYDKAILINHKLVAANSFIYNDVYLSEEYEWADCDATDVKIKLTEQYNKYNKKTITVNQTNGILYIGQYGTSGYAIAAKGYIVDYMKRGIPVRWEPLYFDNSKLDNSSIVDTIAISAINRNIRFDTVIIHCTPDLWQSLLEKNKTRFKDKKIVGYLAWETSKLKPEWVDAINTIRDIRCPSEYNKRVFIDSGVTSNITVVPHVFLNEPLPPLQSIQIVNYDPNKYTFYTIGELNERKNILNLVDTFCKTFTAKDKVQLICKIHYKTYDIANIEYCKNAMDNIIKKYKTPPACIFIYDPLSDLQLRALHAAGDCYVSLTRSEGFGLTIFDAFNYGKDIIATGYSGHVEYLGKDHLGLVKYKLIKVDGMSNFNTNYEHANQVWADPNLTHVSDLLKHHAEKYLSSRKK